MEKNKIIEPKGFILAGCVLIISVILFYKDNGQLLGSIAAALIAAGLVWVSYIFIRILWMALK